MKTIIVILILLSLLFAGYKISSYIIGDLLDDENRAEQIVIRLVLAILSMLAITLVLMALISIGRFIYYLL